MYKSLYVQERSLMFHSMKHSVSAPKFKSKLPHQQANLSDEHASIVSSSVQIVYIMYVIWKLLSGKQAGQRQRVKPAVIKTS